MGHVSINSITFLLTILSLLNVPWHIIKENIVQEIMTQERRMEIRSKGTTLKRKLTSPPYYQIKYCCLTSANA